MNFHLLLSVFGEAEEIGIEKSQILNRRIVCIIIFLVLYPVVITYYSNIIIRTLIAEFDMFWRTNKIKTRYFLKIGHKMNTSACLNNYSTTVFVAYSTDPPKHGIISTKTRIHLKNQTDRYLLISGFLN